MAKASGSIDLKSLKVAGEGASKYITEINSDGIFISPSSQFPTTSATGNSVKINGDGMEVFKGGVSVAMYGDSSRIGEEEGAAFHINANSLQAYYINDENNRQLYFQVSPNSMSYGSHVVVDSDYLRDNYLNSSDTSIAIASATDGKLNSSQGNGRVSWDEFGTLTITREIPSSNETYAIEIGAQGIEFQYQGKPAASIDKDRLIIDKTVVLDEMEVGSNKWTWKIDPDDNSIFLKWIGEEVI